MYPTLRRALVSICALVVTVPLWACTAAPQPAQTPAVITVVNTVPVEVTRVVEIPQTVEVVREVIVTQIIEVLVTTTPTVTPEVTSTPTPSPTSAFILLATPSPTLVIPPGVKVSGYAPLKVVNETEQRLVVEVSGPVFETFTLQGKDSLMRIVPEGEYTYSVTLDTKVIYRGTMKITNPDKHELKLRQDKAVFWIP